MRFRVGMLGLALAALPAFAQVMPQVGPIREQARLLYRQGQYDEARRLYDQIVKLQPQDVDVLKEAMWGFWNMGSYAKAVDVAHRIVALRPDDPDAHNILQWAPEQREREQVKQLRQHAVEETQSGRPEAAVRHYRELARLQPDNIAILHEFMWSLWNVNHFDEAAQVSAQLLKLNPGDKEAIEVRDRATRELFRRELANIQEQAHAFEATGQRAKAAALYQDLVNKEPNDPMALRMLIWSLEKEGELEEAKTQAYKLMSLTPNDPENWNLLARMQMAGNQTAEALESYKKSLALDPHQPIVQVQLSKYDVMNRDFNAAISKLTIAEADNPSLRDLYTLEGKAYYYSGHFPEARRAWVKACQRFPDNSELCFNAAQARYYAGDPEGAIQEMQELFKRTQNPHALIFVVDDNIVQHNIRAAEQLLESQLTNMKATDEPWAMKLAALYQGDKEYDALENLLNRFLQVWPDHQPALGMKAALLYDEKRYRESLQVYQRLHRVNPYSTGALMGIISCNQALVRSGEALQAAEALLRIDPTEPQFIFMHFDALYQAGYHTLARQKLLQWLDANKREPILPVLLYHDLTPFKRDASLAYPYHYSVEAFDTQMKAVHDGGYTPVTIEEVNQWLAGERKLPPKPIVIAFDDNRRDSFEYADPILEKYDLKATMFVALVNVDYHRPPAFVSWDELRRYQENGRWELQCHGDIAHIFIPVTPDGGKGLYLVNRQYLADQKRMETVAEWHLRIANDHASAIQKMTQNLGHVPTAFAWPEGLYGQDGNTNEPTTSPTNLALVRQYFKSAWTQDHFGLNVRSKDPAHMTRIIPNNTWTGEDLLNHFHDHNPLTLAYLRLLDWASWDGRTREAYHWLEEAKKMDISDETLLRSEAQIRFGAGDFHGGYALANRSLMLGEDAETEKMIENYQTKMGPQWIPSFSYQTDNSHRIGREFLQTLTIPSSHNLQWRLAQLYGHYTQPGIHSASDLGAGFGLDTALGLFHSLSVDVMGHAIDAREYNNQITYSGSLASKWTDKVQTSLEVGRSLYNYASSYDQNIWTRYVQGTARWSDGGWDVVGRGKGTALSDDNNRVLGQLLVSRDLVRDSSLRLTYRFTYDDTKFVTSAYYSPQQLRLNEIGPEYNALWGKHFAFFVRYLPGIGKENGLETQLAHDVQTYLRVQFTPTTSLTPSYEYERTPSYYESFYSLELRHVF